MENYKMSGKSQGISKWMISGNPGVMWVLSHMGATEARHKYYVSVVVYDFVVISLASKLCV